MASFSSSTFLDYNVRLKEFFFHRRLVESAIDDMQEKAVWWYGGRVRDKTRQALGSPNIAGLLVRDKKGAARKNRDGTNKVVKGKRPRPAPNPPIPRVADSFNVTLRNVQYIRIDTPDGPGVRVFIPKFSRTNRMSGVTIPELHEFGGTVKARAKVGWKLPDNHKRRKQGAKSNRRSSTLVFSDRFPIRSFRIPARPYLGANLMGTGKTGVEKTEKDMKRRIANAQYPFKVRGL